jgi:hypothetical protein
VFVKTDSQKGTFYLMKFVIKQPRIVDGNRLQLFMLGLMRFI